MSGTPSEAEIKAQWTAAVNVLEKTRNFADGTMAPAGGIFDVLEQLLEGEYTVTGLSQAVARYRSGLSDLVTPVRAREFLEPLLFEYGRIITEGSGYTDAEALMRGLYEWFATNSGGAPLTVESRAITFDTSATSGGTGGVITGNGVMHRLTTDENGYDLEACHVETKRFRCRADQNSGTQEHAEQFEFLGDPQSQDSLLRAAFGSGTSARNRSIVAKHAGTGAGGSLLRNSSFTTFDNASTETKFTGWTQSYSVMTASGVSQDTTNYYRSHPGGGTTNGSLKLTVTGGSTNSIIMTQTLANMRTSRLDSNTPYFFRVMINPTVGTAAGGTVKIRCGSSETTLAVSAMAGNWEEMTIALDEASWFRNFNADPMSVAIEWVGGTSGYMLFDDVILAPFDEIDGTYWALTGGSTPFLVDDTLAFTDTGGAPATGKIQWWLFVAGLGYLPSAVGTPDITEPT